MKKPVALVLALLIAVVAYLLLRPTEEDRIRSRLEKLSKTLSVDEKVDQLSRLGKSKAAAGFFAEPFSVQITFARKAEIKLFKRSEITEKVVLALNHFKELEVSFSDVKVNLAADKKSAEVKLLALAAAAQEAEMEALDLLFKFVPYEGEWSIQEIQTLSAIEGSEESPAPETSVSPSP